MTFQPKCGKITYASNALAKKALKTFNRSGIEKKLTATYYCEGCSGYHLTSMNKRDSRKLTRFLNNRAK